ncbi:primosomal protein N' [Tenuibacillus multivorans]|uniref:Replication restart protein PriA n=1 Tax=Tenuibacillus multivorans TaxID=237069 RepID=A0A1G9Y4P1_9BACI|nr:primosomal protein N' [Tenuibacillus multivorans]GEL75928.1 primosomal protein N' [Tenuibacillus multivorans]SDN03435.1 replication restart DNA helicase PriA [Tenuibacillus multivorans]
MKVAKVIVDVAASPIDSTFDYDIPEKLEHVVQKGIRVIVPFGKRKVMGFVVDLASDSEFDQLKPIQEVMDYTPILTSELLELSSWLQEQTLCYRISALQAMLPAVFKASYDKEVWLIEEEDHLPEKLRDVAQGREVFPFSDLDNSSITHSQVSKYINDQLMDIKYIVKGKNRIKKHTYVEPAQEVHLLMETNENMPGRAKKQKEILEHFIDHPESVLLNDLIKQLQTTRGPVDALVEKGILKLVQKEVYRDPYEGKNEESTKPLALTNLQQQAIDPILDSIESNTYRTFLLHGVTGSGKTEIYLQSIQEVLSKGQEAIVLVPEIALTPQMVSRFKARFGDDVAVLHSGLSAGEKYDEWRKIHRQEVRVVVGARSAIFAPFENLGIIIIDEEHETTYKQEDYPKYHAREVAKQRGTNHQCPVVLGSATPTLESYARALKGVYQLLELTERINDKSMPDVEIVDMRQELHHGNRTMFSDSLTEKINDRIERQEQVVLMLNRRGYSTFVMCRECGETISCEHCDISMTYHQRQHKLKCHYCNDEKPMPNQCPSCESDAIRFFGTGTQKVEEALNFHFPDANVIRMDVDTTNRKGAHEKLLTRFGNHEADILLGTQMIAKGLDFKNVTLVGVLAADSMLHLPDFRASEKSFQLLTQVSGRAGRHELPGEVVIQTYTPEHYSVELASQYDYDAFFRKEMQVRKQFHYPPYYYLALINLSHDNHIEVIEASKKVAQIISKKTNDRCQLMGPTPSPMLRIKDRYRYQCMIKYKSREDVEEALRDVLDHFKKQINQQKLQLTVDFEPYHFM